MERRFIYTLIVIYSSFSHGVSSQIYLMFGSVLQTEFSTSLIKPVLQDHQQSLSQYAFFGKVNSSLH